MKISIVIPALNEAASIAHAVQAAIATGADEVIVVDGGSDDQTVSIAQKQPCRVLHADQGRAAQMNRGAAEATGDVLLFLHADNTLPPLACQQILDALVDPNVCWGGFHQAIGDARFVYRWIERGNALRAKVQGLVYGDQGMFVRRSTFQALGGFPSISLMEDFRLSQQLVKISNPVLLQGPINVSARRWQDAGVFRQTFRNWCLSLAFRFGVSPDRLARWYQEN